MKRVKRKKKFLGAIIGAAIGLAGGAISSMINANAQKKAADKQAQLQKEANDKQQALQNRSDTISYANNLTNVYNNQDYADEYRKKVTFKYGGNMDDRLKRAKRLKCGGRRKASAGIDWGPIITGAGSAIGSITSSAINANAMNYATNLQRNYFVESSGDSNRNVTDNGKGSLKKPSYIEDYLDRIAQSKMYKCGGRKVRK